MEKKSVGKVILWECSSDLLQTYHQTVGELHQCHHVFNSLGPGKEAVEEDVLTPFT